MADTKISALPASTTPLAGTEVLPIVQGGTTKQVSVANLTAGRAVSALTYNGLTVTAAATGFTIAGGTTSKTLTINNTLAFSGTDSTTMTFPSTNATIARTDAAQTFTGVQSLIKGPTGGVNDSGGTYDYYWKIGTLTLTGSQTAKVSVRGAGAYGGSNLGNEINAIIRASNAGTIFGFQFGSTMSLMFNDFGYVSLGSNQYDIYVKQNQDYNNTTAYVETNGVWTPQSVNTGSASAPGSFVSFTKRWSFGFSGGEVAYFDSNSNLIFNTAAKGVNFTANTPAAGMTSQLLNWYEEGTCTFGVTFGGGNTGITYVSSYYTGTYTRIGRQVTVTGLVFLSNKGSSTGTALITGLPFATNSGNGGFSAASLAIEGMTYTGMVMGRTDTSSTSISLLQLTEAGVFSLLTDANFTNDTQIRFTITYTV